MPFAAPAARVLPPLLVLLLLAPLLGCDTTEEAGTTTFVGRVVDTRSVAIEGAVVSADRTAEQVRTDAEGRYRLPVEIDSTGVEVRLRVFASGYEEATRSVTGRVDAEVEVPDIRLPRAGGGPGEGEDGGPGEGADEPSGPAASITLLQRSSETIGVQGAGTEETATLTFVALDAFGNPVDEEHALEVHFEIVSGPGGGEFIAPTSKPTNAAGRVQTTVSSGTRAGTVQVLATATSEEGQPIRSRPIVITITGGLPDEAHFSVAPAQRNIPGYDVYGLTTPVTAFVGDRYGNPVQPGTAVYFTTDTGLIEGSGVTDPLGRTTVTLLSADPLSEGAPPAACPDANPNGYGRIAARTSDDEQRPIEAGADFLFSASAEVELLEVAAGEDGLGTYRFRVSDRFGHPLGPGTTVAVVADGANVRGIGDVELELGDYLCPGLGRTDFGVAVVKERDSDEDGPAASQLETLTITVRSVNGDIQLTLFRTGGRAAPHFETRIERL